MNWQLVIYPISAILSIALADGVAPLVLFDEAPIGKGWSPFNFLNNNEIISQGYYSNSTTDLLVRLADLECPGDRFTVLIDGWQTLNSSIVDFNDCATYTNDENVAFFGRGWSRLSFLLPAGFRKIEIAVLTSPLDGGTASIRFDQNYFTR